MSNPESIICRSLSYSSWYIAECGVKSNSLTHFRAWFQLHQFYSGKRILFSKFDCEKDMLCLKSNLRMIVNGPLSVLTTVNWVYYQLTRTKNCVFLSWSLIYSIPDEMRHQGYRANCFCSYKFVISLVNTQLNTYKFNRCESPNRLGIFSPNGSTRHSNGT